MAGVYSVEHQYPFKIRENILPEEYQYGKYSTYSKARSVQLFNFIGYMERIKRKAINVYKNGKFDYELSLEDCKKELTTIYEEHPEYLI